MANDWKKQVFKICFWITIGVFIGQYLNTFFTFKSGFSELTEPSNINIATTNKETKKILQDDRYISTKTEVDKWTKMIASWPSRKSLDSFSQSYKWMNMNFTSSNLTNGDILLMSNMQSLTREQNDSLASFMEEIKRINNGHIDQINSTLLAHIRKHWIHFPTKNSYYLQSPNRIDHSQGQSYLVDEILKKKRNGFFIECGALDGETRSNTLFFERYRNWTGILVEADPINYQQMLTRHRNAFLIPACLGTVTYPTKMMFYQGRNMGKILFNNKEAEKKQGKFIHVECFPLTSILFSLNRTSVDFLSLDVEGVELDILKTIPFNVININVLTVEYRHAKHGKNSVKKFMETQGYEVLMEIPEALDYVFIKKGIYVN